MPSDRKKLNILSIATLAVLLLVFILPGNSGRITAAILLLPLAALVWVFIKKRSILSLNTRQVIMLIAVIGVLYIILYYLTGLKFGFVKNPYRLTIKNFFQFFLPTAAIIFSTEVIRYVMRAQNSKLADVLSYLSCVTAEVLITATLGSISRFHRFMDFLGLALFPAIVANILYHYLSKRYGPIPNIIYRGCTTLYLYLFAVVPAMPDPLFAFLNLIVPMAVYSFIDMLYEKKRRYALGKKNKAAAPLTVATVVIMAALIMLISNRFAYGALVIATDSMTGELNRGDAAIFEQYDGQVITDGQVIVFEKDGSTVVHRVVDIKCINGVNRYYTKGDVNEDIDEGYITGSNIMGIVSMKVPYVGYPTLWMRGLFSSH